MIDWIVAYLIPRFVWTAYHKARHPIRAWRVHKHNQWVASRSVGDIVCNCSGVHSSIMAISPNGDDVLLEDRTQCSLRHCCDPVQEDNSCHMNRLRIY